MSGDEVARGGQSGAYVMHSHNPSDVWVKPSSRGVTIRASGGSTARTSPTELAATLAEVAERWPTAQLRGHYGSMTASIEVIVDNMVVARVYIASAAIEELPSGVRADGIVVFK